MSHNLTHPTLRSGGDKLGILQGLEVLLLDISRPEIDRNRRAHGANRIINIHDTAIRVASRVANGINTVSARCRHADGFGIGEDLVALVEPGGGEEGGVGGAAGGVDVDVDGAGGAVAEDELGLARGQLGRRAHLQVVHHADAERFEFVFRRFGGGGQQPAEQAGAAAEVGDLRFAVEGGDLAHGLGAGGAAAGEQDGFGFGQGGVHVLHFSDGVFVAAV